VSSGGLALWLEQFAPGAQLRLAVVERGEAWLAGLAMVRRQYCGAVGVDTLPVCPWNCAADLLLDAGEPPDALADEVLKGLCADDVHFRTFDLIPIDAPRWQAFLASAGKAGFQCEVRPHFEVPTKASITSWEVYEASWSKNHRQHMKKALRRAEREGGVVFVYHDAPPPDQVEPLLRLGFEVEDRSWKGAMGTSVLRSPGMFDYLVRQGRMMADQGFLRLAFLERRGTPIAFQYGVQAKGVYHPLKIAYDPEHAALSPGQLLFLHVLMRLSSESPSAAVDFAGPVADSTRKWADGRYRVGRIVLGTPTAFGRMLFAGYRGTASLVRRWRSIRTPQSTPPRSPAI
jgi:hypothetical protein